MAFGQGIVAAVIKVLIDADTKNLTTGMAEAEKRTRAFSDTLSKAGSKMQSLGSRMTATVTLPIVGGMTAAFKAASDFSESLSKATVVFGEQSGAIREWSRTSATAFGLSQQAALEAAGTYGNLFQAFGIGQDEAAKMSMSLVQLAADLASFNNTSVDDALMALRSGLSGETEPLKRFGVAINEARLTTEALNLGLIKEGQKLDTATKAQAIYALVLKDTTLAQGDFKRTSDGAANQMRILKAELTDAAARIGRRLIPVGLDLLKMVREWIDSFQKMNKSSQETLIRFLAFAAATGPLMKLAGVFMSIAGSIAKVSAAIKGAQAASALAAAGQNVAGSATAAGAVSGMAGMLPAAAIVALLAAILGAIKAHSDYKKSVEDNVTKLRRQGGMISRVTLANSGLEISTNDLSGGQRTLADTIKQYREQQLKLTGSLTFVSSEMKTYADRLLTNNLLTVKQSERVAYLISGMDRMGGNVDQLLLKQAENLIAMGDVTGAMVLLKQAARDAAQYLGNVAAATADPRAGMQRPQGPFVPQDRKSNLTVKVVFDSKVFSRQQEYVVRASGF